MSQFVEPMVKDTARQRLVHDIEPIQSEWPAGPSHLTSGFLWFGDAVSGSCLLSVPSSRWFKPRHLWVWNDTTVMNAFVIYCGSGTFTAASFATMGKIYMQPRSTEFIAWDCETWSKDIWVSNLASNLGMRVGGIMLNSAPE